MAVFWSYFRDFVGAQKIEDLSKSKNFFAEVFQITSRFVLARKKVGVRCTLMELTTKSACVPLEVSGVHTYAHVSEFHVLVDRSIA